MVAHHIHDSHAGDGHLEEVGTHVGDRTYEETAVAATLDDEMLGRGPAFGDHILGGRDEIVEDIEFFHLGSGLMPGFAIFGTAAEVGLSVDTTVVKPYETIGRERGIERDVETAISVEVDRI